MDIIPFTNEMRKEWDEFCQTSDDAWFWHTTEWMDYALILRPQHASKQLSFAVKNNNKIIAICPLIMNSISDKRVFCSDLNVPGETPAILSGLISRQRTKLYTLMFGHVDNLAKEYGVASCLMKLTPTAPAFYKAIQYNFLMRFGFYNTSLHTQIIDLSKSLEQLMFEMRDSHRYDIRRGDKLYTTTVFDSSTITKDIFDQYRIMHHKAAGRITRQIETFEMMYQMIKNSHAILCIAENNLKPVSCAYVNVYKDGALYSSSCEDPDICTPVPVSHCIQWNIIKWLKENGIIHYEIGKQQFGEQPYDHPSKKDISISTFKRGFGGSTVPWFSGEKHYV